MVNLLLLVHYNSFKTIFDRPTLTFDKMSKTVFSDGIEINDKQKGLLQVNENLLATIIKNEPISNNYDVEDTPFAR